MARLGDYSGRMTYFTTPTAAAAYYAGMSEDAYTAREDAIVRDLEALDALGQPHLEPEGRDYVRESDVAIATEQDRRDLQWVLDYEQHSLTL